MSNGFIRSIALFGAVSAAALVAVPTGAAPAGASAATVTVAPSGSFHNGESVTISMGPNKVFTPYSRVTIMECADPKGTAANLPTDDTTCDGNTRDASTVLVRKNGSFSAPGYTLYKLPNTTLGELSSWKPVCNRTHKCVLYVGMDVLNFRQPKVFSVPFAIAPGR